MRPWLGKKKKRIERFSFGEPLNLPKASSEKSWCHSTGGPGITQSMYYDYETHQHQPLDFFSKERLIEIIESLGEEQMSAQSRMREYLSL